MPKKILLIESDADFVREASSALEQKGFETRTTGDGKEGLDLARDERPDAIVLCVELPKMSGYSICNKLKKDEALKSIPLVIISAEATQDTFEQHKKLKTRAEDYLIKPFEPSDLADRLAALVGLPTPPSDEEVVTLADVELEALAEPEPRGRPLPELAPGDGAPEEDEDLKLLDDAFESIAAPASGSQSPATPPQRQEPPLGEEVPPPKIATMPAEDESHRAGGPAYAEDEALLVSIGPAGGDEQLALPGEEPPRPSAPIRGANLQALRAAGIPVLENEPIARTFSETAPARAVAPDRSRGEAKERSEAKEQELQTSRPEVAQRDAELRHLRERMEDLEGRLVGAEADLRKRDADLGSAQSRLEALSASTKKLEGDLRSSREETLRAGERALEAEKGFAQARDREEEAERGLAQARERQQEAERGLAQARERAQEAERAVGDKAAEAAAAIGKVEAFEQEIEGLRTELNAARTEATAARIEVDERTAELRKRIQDLESANSKNEERVVKAYQKIKGDEKLREKTRKALTIALQLLDEHGPSTEATEKRTGARE